MVHNNVSLKVFRTAGRSTRIGVSFSIQLENVNFVNSPKMNFQSGCGTVVDRQDFEAFFTLGGCFIPTFLRQTFYEVVPNCHLRLRNSFIRRPWQQTKLLLYDRNNRKCDRVVCLLYHCALTGSERIVAVRQYLNVVFQAGYGPRQHIPRSVFHWMFIFLSLFLWPAWT